jgi:Fe2+ transport system protein FeoA
VTLSKLRRGDSAVITKLDNSNNVSARLAARGIVPGVNFELVTPGDPCVIGVENDRWALSETEASLIHVSPENSNQSSIFAKLLRWG